jgi:hypothetical protein
MSKALRRNAAALTGISYVPAAEARTFILDMMTEAGDLLQGGATIGVFRVLTPAWLAVVEERGADEIDAVNASRSYLVLR